MLRLSEPTLLLLYSDGLIESRTTDIDEGIDHLAQALDAAVVGVKDTARPDVLPALSRHLLSSLSAADANDDRTLLLAELSPAAV
uniref:PPM-type phosphatase domain-containing protein n=1 Tax=Streptomyces avermitilis TaxID=33903 RepID=A0A499VNT4_STRAX|nr:hypothetical protein SAVMC3_87140 [Streptomyces avermitilis]